jgi:hypothetical protein
MIPNCGGTARIRHSETGKIYSIASGDLDWDSEGVGERQMGSEIRHQATLEHPDLGTLTWSLWEYPVGVQNYKETNVGNHVVIDDFRYGLEHTE